MPLLVEDTTHVDAPISLVWSQTLDLPRWPEWTPTVTSARWLTDETPAIGSQAQLKQPGLPSARWEVTHLTPETLFVWKTRSPGLRLQATHALAAQGSGTQNTLQVQASGPLAVLLRPLLQRMLRRALQQENQGLKERCESRGQS